MGVVHGGEYADDHAHGGLRGDAAAFADEVLEGLAGDVLHDDIAHVVVLADIEEVDDVFMRHLGRGLGFAAEAAHEFLVLLVFRTQDFDGDGAPVELVPGAVDHGHAAGADDGLDLVAPEITRPIISFPPRR